MGTTIKHSESLSARQRARSALQTEKKELERKEKALSGVFTELARRERGDRRLGDRLRVVKELGVTNAALSKETGLAAKEISALLALDPLADADDSDESDDESSDDGEAGDVEAATAQTVQDAAWA